MTSDEMELAIEDDEDDELRRARMAARESEHELGLALNRLQQSVREPFGVARRIRDAPLAWCVGAFTVGFLLGRAANR